MEGIEVPPFFLCPISLQIMRDPVILSTGMTYDRDSIEQWIYSGKHNTCPVTRVELTQVELTPNHTLRRLIQSWCTANASNGIERFPTPRPPVDGAQIGVLLDEINIAETQMKALRKLKVIVSENERNKRCVEASGAANVLVSVVKKSLNITNNLSNGFIESNGACHEALVILCLLQLSEQSLIHLIETNDNLLDTLTKILSYGNYQSRAYAVLFLKTLMPVISPNRLYGLSKEFFHEIVMLLRDQISYVSTKAAIQVLASVANWGRNRIKAVEAGAVSVLIELLLDQQEKKGCEIILVALEQMCRCAEGRACFVGNAAGIAVVSKKILRVSHLANGLAVKILQKVAKFSGSSAVLHEMLEVGMVSKMCLLLQVEFDEKIRQKVKEMLKLHSRVWRNSPCLSPQLRASYPS